ncbi:MAG TPA: hypothetical protein VGO67_18430 [Verrucomicrobiae bacterium]|jgi:hypothetical protein
MGFDRTVWGKSEVSDGKDRRRCQATAVHSGRVRVKVREEGIVLRIRGKRLAFFNEHTGPLIGREVFAFYNMEQPQLLTVSDLNRQNFFTVKSHILPAMSATKEQFAAVNADRAGHMRHAKEIYGSIEHPNRLFIQRDDDISQEVKELGRFHNSETEQFKQEQAATNRTIGKIQQASAATGIPVPRNLRHPERVLEGVQEEVEFWREEGRSQPTETTVKPKTYVLKSDAAPKPSVKLFWTRWAILEKAKPRLNRHALTQKTIGCHPMPKDDRGSTVKNDRHL